MKKSISKRRSKLLPVRLFEPTEWVLVNDGSSDRTGDIIDRYAAKFPWISVVHRSNRGFRKSGGGVIEAFYEGYNALHCNDWEFVVKLDGDLTFSCRLILKNVLSISSVNPKLGVGGGEIYHDLGGVRNLRPIRSSMSEEQPRSIGEPVGKRLAVYCKAPGWDSIDEVKANMLGWKSYSFEELRVVHHRFTGSADGLLRDRIKHGVACYVSGYHPLFVAASCFYRLQSAALCHRFCGDLLRISEGLFYPHPASGRCTDDQVFAHAATQTSLRTRNNLEVSCGRSRDGNRYVRNLWKTEFRERR